MYVLILTKVIYRLPGALGTPGNHFDSIFVLSVPKNPRTTNLNDIKQVFDKKFQEMTLITLHVRGTRFSGG